MSRLARLWNCQGSAVGPTATEGERMRGRRRVLGAMLVGWLVAMPAVLQGAGADAVPRVPAGAKLFVAPMQGFESYLVDAIKTKKVPVVLVADPAQADFVLSGSAESRRPHWSRAAFLGNDESHEQASISVRSTRTSAVAFAYSVEKKNAGRGKQTTAEACVKELKKHIDRKK
jgi:hypothetical protein